MIEVTAFIVSMIIGATLISLLIVGALVALRWLWRLADVAAIEYLERKFAKIKDPVRPPEEMGLAFPMWSMPNFHARDHAAALMLGSKKLRIMRILPQLEIILVTHNHAADQKKQMREFKNVLGRTYAEMKKEMVPHGKSD